MKSCKEQVLAVREAADYLEIGGPLLPTLRRQIQRLVAAAAKADRETRGDECWEHDEGNG